MTFDVSISGDSANGSVAAFGGKNVHLTRQR
jgi:hypothetical protein